MDCDCNTVRKRDDSLVRPLLAEVDEEVAHLGLPSCVDVGRGHRGLYRVEVIALQVADQLPVVGQEE
jgi:hypothetical protein